VIQHFDYNGVESLQETPSIFCSVLDLDPLGGEYYLIRKTILKNKKICSGRRYSIKEKLKKIL